eukprot:3544142-Prymnesium_polylepis.2
MRIEAAAAKEARSAAASERHQLKVAPSTAPTLIWHHTRPNIARHSPEHAPPNESPYLAGGPGGGGAGGEGGGGAVAGARGWCACGRRAWAGRVRG